MNFGISDASTVTFFNRETNEKVFTTDCSIPTLEYITEEEYIPELGLRITTKSEFSLNLGGSKLEGILDSPCKDIPSDGMFKIEVTGNRQIETKEQVKKHKKKRINKKWAKRYGYKIKYIPVSFEIPKCHITHIKESEEITTYEISTHSK